MTAAAEYVSNSCRLGQHPICKEGQARPSPVEGVRVLVCGCGCHDTGGAYCVVCRRSPNPAAPRVADVDDWGHDRPHRPVWSGQESAR